MATYEELKKKAKKEYEEEQKNGNKNSSTQVKSGSSSYEDLKKGTQNYQSSSIEIQHRR